MKRKMIYSRHNHQLKKMLRSERHPLHPAPATTPESFLAAVDASHSKSEQSEIDLLSRTETKETIDRITPNQFTAILHAHDTNPSYSTANHLVSLTKKAWGNQTLSFHERFAIIRELEVYETAFSSDEAYQPEEAGINSAFQVILTYEKNFFLRATIESFTREGYVEYSLEERREMIQKQWDESRVFQNGETEFLADGGVILSLPGEIQGVDELTKRQVRTITDWWIREDHDWLSEHEDQELLTKSRLLDKTIQDAIPSSQLENLPRQETVPDTQEACYLFHDATRRQFISSISPDLGGVYTDGLLTTVFVKPEHSTSGITHSDIERIGSFLNSLQHVDNQALKNLSGASASPEDTPALLRTSLQLLTKINRYFQAYTLFKQEEAETPTTDTYRYASPFTSSYLGENLFNEIFWDTISLLRKEMSATAIPSIPLDDFLSQTLRESTNDTESRDISELYHAFSSARMRVFIESYFGFSFSEIPLRSQIQFLRYVWDKDEDTMSDIRNFVQQATDPRAKSSRFISFLALDQFGPAMDTKILALGRELPPDIADILFQKYAEIIESADQIEQNLRSLIKTNVTPPNTQPIQESLVRQANELLLRSHTALETNDIQKLQTSLDQIHTDTLLFNALFRNLKESQSIIDFSDLNGLDFAHVPSPQLSENDRMAMLDLYAHNYPETHYSETFRSKILHGLETAFRNPQSTFHILKKDGALIAFDRFEVLTENAQGQSRKYWGSFNVAPGHRGSKIGEAFLEQSLEREKTKSVIEAYADPTVPISQHYIEKDGFIGTGVEMIGDRPLLKILYDADLNTRLRSKGTQSLAQDSAVHTGVAAGLILHTRVPDGAIPDFSPLTKGFVLTRFLKTSRDTTYVFEHLPLEATHTETKPSTKKAA